MALVSDTHSTDLERAEDLQAGQDYRGTRRVLYRPAAFTILCLQRQVTNSWEISQLVTVSQSHSSHDRWALSEAGFHWVTLTPGVW